MFSFLVLSSREVSVLVIYRINLTFLQHLKDFFFLKDVVISILALYLYECLIYINKKCYNLVMEKTIDKPIKKKQGFAAHPENINRNGRPKKGQTLTDIAKVVLDEELPSGITRKEALIKKVAQLAYDGDSTMIKLLWNYIDGMPRQRQEVTGADGDGLVIKVIDYDANDAEE